MPTRQKNAGSPSQSDQAAAVISLPLYVHFSGVCVLCFVASPARRANSAGLFASDKAGTQTTVSSAWACNQHQINEKYPCMTGVISCLPTRARRAPRQRRSESILLSSRSLAWRWLLTWPDAAIRQFTNHPRSQPWGVHTQIPYLFALLSSPAEWPVASLLAPYLFTLGVPLVRTSQTLLLPNVHDH